MWKKIKGWFTKSMTPMPEYETTILDPVNMSDVRALMEEQLYCSQVVVKPKAARSKKKAGKKKAKKKVQKGKRK